MWRHSHHKRLPARHRVTRRVARRADVRRHFPSLSLASTTMPARVPLACMSKDGADFRGRLNRIAAAAEIDSNPVPTVLIAAPACLGALKDRLEFKDALAFADIDALRAFDA